jgi:hypothetical protein
MDYFICYSPCLSLPSLLRSPTQLRFGLRLSNVCASCSEASKLTAELGLTEGRYSMSIGYTRDISTAVRDFFLVQESRGRKAEMLYFK